MQITRIRIEQFRQFRQALEISALQPGLNLFCGPNEAGKSTVVAAIRAAFFERHRSSSVDDLRPWGDAGASPGVEIDFVLGGQACRLRKSFLGKKRCELQMGTLQLDGAQAEDHLALLLGHGHAGKGASSAAHWGVPGLLWVEQGSGHEVHAAVAHAADHLRQALDATLGEMASSSGDEVMASVQAQRNELLTPATGTPRGALAEALKQAEQTTAALQSLDSDIATWRGQVDQLAALRRGHAADETARPWAALRLQEQQARQRLADTEALQAALATEQQRAQQLATQIGLLHEQIEAYAAQDADAERRASALLAAQQALAAATQAVQPWATQAEAAARALEAARLNLQAARQHQAQAQRQRDAQALARQAQADGARLRQAEAAEATLAELQTRVARLALAPPALQTLRRQQQQLRELQIQRDAVATRLQYTLAEGASLHIEGQALRGHGERLLLAPTTLDLGALGSLQIAPGGADLAQLGHRQTAIADEYAALLQSLGLDSLEAAELRHAEHSQAQADARTAAATLQALSPEGLPALRATVQQQALRLQALQADAPPGLAASASESESAPAARLAPPPVADCEAAEEAARRALEQIGAGLNQARLAAGNAQAALEAAEREHRLAQALVQSPERAGRLQAAQHAWAAARADEAALQAGLRTRHDALAAARPAILQQDIERLQRSAQLLEQAHEERKTALLRLELTLQGQGALGLEERRAELARDAAQQQRRADQLRRRAEALDLLLGLLKARRAALTQRLQAPLQARIQHYLALLLPQARLEIAPDLAPARLTREGPAGIETGAFDALSFGAREQMGLISRLAYADVLRSAGKPTLLMLDDALVHSDDERLAQMKRILFDAATRHQILLFTCHPARWRDLGVRMLDLQALRAG